MKKCPVCQAELVSEKAKFCAECGLNIAQYEAEQAKKNKTCPACGAEILGGKFCWECGAKLDAVQAPVDVFADDWLADVETETNAMVSEKEAGKAEKAREVQESEQELLNPFEVEKNSDHTYTITDVKDKTIENVTIPNSVTSIGDYAFYECSSLESIKIPNSVTSIGEGAFFECSSLESIEIPDSVTSIEDFTFYECSSLESIEIPDSVTSIGKSAFSDCSSLESIELPNSVTSIGDSAFFDCSSIRWIEIPNGVKTIDNFAFCQCSSLQMIEIPSSVNFIGLNAFYKTDSLVINYNGTKREWDRIAKKNCCLSGRVNCTDSEFDV